MIIDNIKNAHLYENLHPDFKAVFEFMAKLDDSVQPGRYDISDTAYVSVKPCDSKKKEFCKFEAHEKYADIQFVIKGKELIDITSIDGMEITKDSMAEKDFALYGEKEEYSTAFLGTGDFALIYPKEAHKPGRAVNDEPMTVYKAVAKVLINA